MRGFYWGWRILPTPSGRLNAFGSATRGIGSICCFIIALNYAREHLMMAGKPPLWPTARPTGVSEMLKP